jgi:hypothetical protein
MHRLRSVAAEGVYPAIVQEGTGAMENAAVEGQDKAVYRIIGPEAACSNLVPSAQEKQGLPALESRPEKVLE